jgi:DNA-binding beta-propeller fold protein YncE
MNEVAVMGKSTFVGNGTHTYMVAEGWAKLPEGFNLGYTHGIVVDKDDNVYVFHTGSPSIIKFDNDGNFLSAWGEQFEGGAHGFYLHEENGAEYLYITDTKRNQMVKLSLDGETLLTISTPDLPEIYDAQRKFIPTDVAVSPNGNIYVTDGYGQHWIHVYTATGQYIRSFGGKGSEPGHCICPHGISIDVRSGEPEVYVADRGNNRFQVFTLDGIHKRFVIDDMDKPCNFYFFGDEVYVPDLDSRVSIYDRNDRLITHLGEDQQAYKQKGWPNLELSYFRSNKFSSPHGVCVDAIGNVYVAEWTVKGRITKLIRNR